MQKDKENANPQRSESPEYKPPSPGKRKKKKGIEVKDFRDESSKYGGRFSKNDFVERKSILDQINTDSGINQSPFRGILRMTLLLALIYVINSIFHDLLRKKSWDESVKQFKMIKIYGKEIATVMTHWVGYIAYSHLSFILQKLVAYRLIN